MVTQTVHDALGALRDLATPTTMRALAGQGLAPAVRPKVNAHIHLPPNFSAFESVEQAVGLAAAQGVGVLGVSNYYDFDVYQDFAALARAHGILPLFGLEIIVLIDELVRAGVLINDPGNPGKMYLCGKGITQFAPMTPTAERIVGIIRHNDSERMEAMAARLAGIFAERGLDTGLGAEAIIDRVVRRHGCPRARVTLQERHLCQAFQEILFERVPPAERPARLSAILGAPSKAAPDDFVRVQNEIRSHLMKAGKPAFVQETFIDFEQARELILALGGIPCYPTLADGSRPICPFENPLDKLIAELKERNLNCAELIPIRNTPQVLARYAEGLRAAGIVVTAGTEHNTLDLLAIEPACLKGAPVPEAIKEIFWEGARVVAAHQFLTLNGECGYVDGAGALNPAYASQEERIAALARLGAAVIRRTQDSATE